MSWSFRIVGTTSKLRLCDYTAEGFALQCFIKKGIAIALQLTQKRSHCTLPWWDEVCVILKSVTISRHCSHSENLRKVFSLHIKHIMAQKYYVYTLLHNHLFVYWLSRLTISGVFRGTEHEYLLHFSRFWKLLRILYGFKMFRRTRLWYKHRKLKGNDLLVNYRVY